jgi:hypothetical protein
MGAVTKLRLSPYIFVLFDQAKGEGGPIKNTRGVQELLCNSDGVPRPLPHGHDTIAQLRQFEDEELSNATHTFKKGRTDLTAGATVRIDGKNPFQGKVGLLVSSLRGVATLLCGPLIVTVPDIDLTELTK